MIFNYFGRKKGVLGFGKIDLSYDISKNKTLEFTNKFNTNEAKDKSEILFNSDYLNEKLQSNKQSFDQKLIYTHKLDAKKVLIFSGRYINENAPQDYNVNQFIYQDLFAVNANNVTQKSNDKMQFLGFQTRFLDRKANDDLLEFQLGNQFRKDYLNTNFILKFNENEINLPNDIKII